jgi:hypothetical protein
MSRDASSSNAEQTGPFDDTTEERRAAGRNLWFVLAAIAFALACVAIALQYFFAEPIPKLTQSELDRAKKRWQVYGAVSYDMDIEVRGKQPANIHVEVRKRVVTAETRDGRVPPERTWDSWSVPGLFKVLDENLMNAEDTEHQFPGAKATGWQMSCEFDPDLGIPRRYHQTGTDVPEVYWWVKRFQIR